MLATSATLLERLREPGSPAWPRFVALYTPLIYHWAKRFGLRSDDAADLVQEVLAVAVRRMPTFDYRPTQSFRGCLYTVTRNQWRRSVRGRDPVAAGPLGDPEDPRAGSPDAGEDREYARILVGRGLDLIRGEFSAVAWRAFEGHGLHARPAGEVAAELGVQPGTVYAAKSRVLARLRVVLAGFENSTKPSASGVTARPECPPADRCRDPNPDPDRLSMSTTPPNCPSARTR